MPNQTLIEQCQASKLNLIYSEKHNQTITMIYAFDSYNLEIDDIAYYVQFQLHDAAGSDMGFCRIIAIEDDDIKWEKHEANQ